MRTAYRSPYRNNMFHASGCRITHMNHYPLLTMDAKVLKIILAILLTQVGKLLQVGATEYLWINIVLLFLTFGVGALNRAFCLVLTEQKG